MLKKRLHWKSRRGLLELDLLLHRFWQKHGNDLSARELRILSEWLAMDDDSLWRLLKKPPLQSMALAAKISP